jgi:hypothetical protein
MPGTRSVTTERAYGKLNRSQRESYHRTLDALSGMRRGQSLTAAAREAGTTPATVRRYAGATVKRPGGRYTLGRDRLYRPMRILTNTGVRTVGVGRQDSKIIGGHWNSVNQYLRAGDSSALEKFTGVSVGGYELQTDLDAIDELAGRGELEFEDIYELAT